jgi:hypothetical protein
MTRTTGIIAGRIALVLVLVYTCATTAGWLRHGVQGLTHPAQDEISANDRRFAELRPILPPRGVVGYLGHPEPTGATPREADAAALLHFRRYLLAQYALAPLLLTEGTEPEFVVGNFEPGRAPAAPHGFRVAREFASGLILYQRVGS